MKNILLIGPPGAGKGTQAKFLEEEYNLIKIDTGSLIRESIKIESELGKEAKKFVEAGVLIPDELIINLILGEIEKTKVLNKKFLLDGFPRNLKQAEALDEKNIFLDAVIEIQVDQEKLLKRIVGRRICNNKNCGAVYHTEFKAPKKSGICDLCSSELYQRKDDQEELVKARLATYLRETLPLTNFYGEKNKLIKINGNQEVACVFEEIKQKLNFL